MADYHSVVSHAVSGSFSAEARRAIYERARIALRDILSTRASDVELATERTALEAAILKVEAQSIFNSTEREREEYADGHKLRSQDEDLHQRVTFRLAPLPLNKSPGQSPAYTEPSAPNRGREIVTIAVAFMFAIFMAFVGFIGSALISFISSWF
jgi:hypothetical protein